MDASIFPQYSFDPKTTQTLKATQGQDLLAATYLGSPWPAGTGRGSP